MKSENKADLLCLDLGYKTVIWEIDPQGPSQAKRLPISKVRKVDLKAPAPNGERLHITAAGETPGGRPVGLAKPCDVPNAHWPNLGKTGPEKGVWVALGPNLGTDRSYRSWVRGRGRVDGPREACHLMAALGARVKQLRQAKDLRARDVWPYLDGCSGASFSQLELGRRKTISVQWLLALCDVLGCSLDWLLRGHEKSDA